MKPKPRKIKNKTKKDKDLWKNPSYKNMLNPYESKYPQGKKKSTVDSRRSTAKNKNQENR